MRLSEELSNVQAFVWRGDDMLRSAFRAIGEKAMEKGVFRAPFDLCIFEFEDDTAVMSFLLRQSGDTLEVGCYIGGLAANTARSTLLVTLTFEAGSMDIRGSWPEAIWKRWQEIGPVEGEEPETIAEQIANTFKALWGSLHSDAYHQAKHTVSDRQQRKRFEHGLLPLAEPVVLRLKSTVDVARLGTKISYRLPVRGHNRRGHERTYKSGKTIWVNSAKVKGGEDTNRNYIINT